VSYQKLQFAVLFNDKIRAAKQLSQKTGKDYRQRDKGKDCNKVDKGGGHVLIEFRYVQSEAF